MGLALAAAAAGLPLLPLDGKWMASGEGEVSPDFASSS